MIEPVILDGGGDIVIIAIIGFFGGIFAMFYGFKMYRRYQLIRDTPTSKVQSISIGTVELSGTVESAGDKHLYKHPLEDRNCVYYTRKVEEYHPDDDGSDWETVLKEEVGDKFYLNDGTGKVLIRPDDPDPDLENKARKREKLRFDSDEEEVPRAIKGAASKDDGIFPDFLSGGQKYRVTVESVWPNMDLYIFGYARPRDIEDSFAKNEQNVVVGNGADAGSENVISKIPFLGNSQPFIIANQHEQELIKERKYLGPISFFGGLIVSSGCLAYLLFLFGV